MFQFLTLLGNKTAYYAIAAILAILLIFFLFYGDTLLSSLGFQTKSNLKAEVARLQEENKQLQTQLDVLHEAMKKKDEFHRSKIEAVSSYCQEQEKIYKKTQAYKKNIENLKSSKPSNETPPEDTAVIYNIRASYKEIFIGEKP
jgi:chromosome segregation ATPase